MAKKGCITNGYIQVAGVALSDHCESFTPTYGNRVLPAHAHGDTQEYSNPGLQVRGLSARFYGDFAAGSVFATLNPLKNRAKHNVVYREDSGAATALNPTFSGSYFISNITGLVGGRIGDNSMVDVTWEPAGIIQEATS